MEAYELAPKPGTTVMQRKDELVNARFVAVWNLAHQVYKRKGGSCLLDYGETLNDRNGVILDILQYELQAGLIVPDYEGRNLSAQSLVLLKKELTDLISQRLTEMENVIRNDIQRLTHTLRPKRKGKKR